MVDTNKQITNQIGLAIRYFVAEVAVVAYKKLDSSISFCVFAQIRVRTTSYICVMRGEQAGVQKRKKLWHPASHERTNRLEPLQNMLQARCKYYFLGYLWIRRETKLRDTKYGRMGVELSGSEDRWWLNNSWKVGTQLRSSRWHVKETKINFYNLKVNWLKKKHDCCFWIE